MCDLISRSFGDFVQTINSENLLSKPMAMSGDAAKAQSWMSPLEFKRVAFSNEIQLQGGRARCVTCLMSHTHLVYSMPDTDPYKDWVYLMSIHSISQGFPRKWAPLP